MNTALLRSRWAALGAVGALAVLAWGAVDYGVDFMTSRPSRLLRLASGWCALASMAFAFGYVLRKYAHRLRYSPEFRMRTDYALIEAATRGLQRLQEQLQREPDVALADARARVRDVVRGAGAHRVMTGRVTQTHEGIRIRAVPTEPLGRMAGWMGLHLAVGLLFSASFIVHSGVTSASRLGLAMIAASAAVIGSGFFGLYAWVVGPARLTRAERDLTVEEAFALQGILERRVEEVDDAGDAGVLRAQLERVRAEHRRLRRTRALMTAWKAVHAPAAVALLALVLAHLYFIWRY